MARLNFQKWIIIALFLTFSMLLAKSKTTDPNYSTLPEGVSIYQLDNGMQVVMIEKPSLPMIGVNVVVKVGSAYETFASSGMSHMLEHLLFNGTNEMKQKELYDAVDRIGGYNNANTGDYYTNYMMVTPSENIKAGMQIQSGMLFHSLLPVDKFEKEKGIVMEEIAKSLARPAEQSERNISAILYKGHALSLPTLGTYETIKGMSRDEVNAFYKNFYVPNNMILSVIGNFQTAEMLEMINEIYGDEKPGAVDLHSTAEWATGFNLPHSEEIENYKTFHRFYSGKNTRLEFFYRLPENLSNEFFPLMDYNLEKRTDELQEKLNKSYPDIASGVEFQTRRTPIGNYLQATVLLKKADKNAEVIKYINDWLRKFKFVLSKTDVESKAVKARTTFLKLTEKPHMFGIMNADKIAKEGLETILEAYDESGYYVAGKELTAFQLQNDPFIIVQHPDRKKKGETETKSIAPEIVLNGSGGATSGVPVVIAKEIPGSNLLAIHYLFKHKAELESTYGTDAAKFWHNAFGERMKDSKVAAKSIAYGLTLTVNDNPWIPMDNIYLHPDFGYIRVEGLADDIPGAIAFLNKQMMDFRPSKKEFEKAVASFKRMAMMMGGGHGDKMSFDEVVNSHIYEADKFPPAEEELTYEKFIEFGKRYFIPSNIIITVVSPAEPNQIKEYFSEFQSPANSKPLAGVAWQKQYKDIPKEKTITGERNPKQAQLFYGFIHDIQVSETAALNALSLLLRDEIVFDIREKQGLAYRMSAGIVTKENKALFYIKMGTRPENVEKVIPQFPGFFTSDFVDQITEKNLSRAISMYMGKMMFRRLSSINQAYYLGNSFYFENDVNADSEYLEKLKNVTVEEVQKVAEKYLDNKNSIKIVF